MMSVEPSSQPNGANEARIGLHPNIEISWASWTRTFLFPVLREDRIMYLPLFRNLISCLSQHFRHGRFGSRRLRIVRFRPRLEDLEERALPATFTFTQSGGGAWEDPTNWIDENGHHGTPGGASDDAYIPDLNFGASVTVTGYAACGMLQTDQLGAVEIDGGRLFILNPSQLDGLITLNSGTLWMQSGTIVNNTFTWTGGQLFLHQQGYDPVTFNAPIQIAGSDEKSLASGPLVNTVGITQTGTGNLNLTSETLWNKATYDLESDADIQDGISQNGGIFQNDGIFQKTASSGTSTVSAAFNNSPGGQIMVTSGTVRLSNVGTWTGAALSVLPDCHLLLDGGRTLLSGGIGGAGGGEVRIESGVFSVDPMGAAFAFDPNMLNWTGGSFWGPGILTVNAGTTLTLSGDDPKTIGNFGYLRNLGTITQMGDGDLRMNGTVENAAAATYELQSDAGVLYGEFINAGTLRKLAGIGTSTFGTLLENQGGSIDVQAGTLSLQDLGASTGGNFTAALGTALDVENAGPLTGTYTGSGDGQVRLEATNTILLGPGGATFDFTPGLFRWVSGGINPSTDALTNDGTITLVGDSFKVVLGLLLNNGTIVQTGGGSFYAENLMNNPGGVYDLQFTGDPTGGISAGSFTNLGTLETSASPSTVACSFTNAAGGRLDVFSANLRFTQSLTNDGGTVLIEDNSNLSVFGTYTQTTGFTTLNQSASVASLAADTVDLQGGSLLGSGLILGNVRNAGQVAPGGSGVAGHLSIVGNYTQTDTGTLLIELGGLTAGTEYDQLKIGGSAQLGGKLQVSLINGYSPNVGDTFQIVTYGSIANTTSILNVQVPDLGNAMHLETQPDTTSLSLVTIGDPPSPPSGV
jgi:hypothetical protein